MLRSIGVLVMLAALPALAGEEAFRVVVNGNNPIASITRAELSAIYMKRTKSWSGGREITAVEQSHLREEFSRAVHGKSVAYVTRYWQRLIFSGRGLPPRQLPNDAAVLDFVKGNPGAIGYISRGTPADGVKAIAVTR